MGLNGVRDFTRGMYMATGPMKIPAVQIPNLYVYCNILEHVIVGDATAPLLRIVNGGQDKIITKNENACVSEYFNLCFCLEKNHSIL